MKKKSISGAVLAFVLLFCPVSLCAAESAAIQPENIIEGIDVIPDTQESLPAAQSAGESDLSGTAAVLSEDGTIMESGEAAGSWEISSASDGETVIDLEISEIPENPGVPESTENPGSPESSENSENSIGGEDLYDGKTYSGEEISIDLEEEPDLSDDLASADITIEEEEISTESPDLEDYLSACVSSFSDDLPDYDTWLANTMISGFGGSQGIYPLFQSFQDPVYLELGGYLLEDKALTNLSASWSALLNEEYRKPFTTQQKYIYEVILMSYLKYGMEEESASLDLSSNEIKFSMELQALLADELTKNISDYTNGMSVEQASSFLSKAETLKECGDIISFAKTVAKDTGDLVSIISDYLALQKVKEERIILLKAAKDACGSSNPSFVSAAEDIIEALQSTEIEYAEDRMGKVALDFFCDRAWDKLKDTFPVLKMLNLGLSGLDACFDSTNKASNNLKLALLYTTDCYMKLGMLNSASKFSNSKTSENGKNFLSCFQAYAEFQIYGNTYARTWLEGYLDGGVFSNFINMVFYRENISTAKELLSISDSQTANRKRLLELINVYAGIYEKLYGNFEVKIPVPVTGVRFSVPSMILYENEVLPVIAEVLPENADNKNVTYTSSDPSVVAVPEKGGFAAIRGVGTATITAKTEDGGFTATQTVTIKKKTSSEVIKQGSCGDKAWFKLYENGFLYIYGEGTVNNLGSLKADVRKIAFSDKITAVGNNCFSDFTNLTEITMPDSLTSIGSAAFTNCSNLKEIKFSGGLTSIDYLTFGNCTSLEKLDLPDSLTSIGKSAFKDCSNLKEIKFSDSLTSIGEFAFENCTSLEKISLPDSLTSIGWYIFSRCSGLKEIEFPSSLISIGDGVFKSCTSLEKISLPDSVASIGNDSFSFCSSLKEIKLSGSLITLGSRTFEYCPNLTKIDLPDGVISIGDYTFRGCSALKEIKFSSSLSSIGWEAFKSCSSLEKLIFPDSLTSIDRDAFSGCSGLEEIRFPDGMTSIWDYAFSGYSNLKRITLPGKLTSIGVNAFSNCPSLEKLDLPDSVASIGESAFYGCSGLKEIKFSSSLTSISNGAFKDCSSLEKLDLPDSLTSIDWDVFSGCTGLKEIRIPNSVTSIDSYAFNGFSSLKEIKFPKNLTSIGNGAFKGCSGLEKLDLPDGVTSIGWYVFSGCTGLKEINFPDKLTSIEEEAFKDCSSLKEVKFPASLTSLGSGAFSGCTGLKEIEFTGNAPSFAYENDSFTDVTATAVYPAGDSTWLPYHLTNHGGTLTWVSDKNKKTSLTTCKITLPSSVTYSGKKLTPSVTVKNGSKKLKKGTDYTLTFTKNKNPGTASVTIKGKGSYTGTVKKSFQIVPASAKLTVSRLSKRNSVKLSWKKVPGADGYVIQRKNSKGKWADKKVIKKGTTRTYTDTSAKKGKAWSYRIRAYCKVGSKKVYGSWSSAKSKK